MLMLGVIGEYLGRLFMTTNARPQYIIRETQSPIVELESGRVEARLSAAHNVEARGPVSGQNLDQA
jgi:hypothetical protein